MSGGGNAWLNRIGQAAMSGLSDAEVEQDPARAMKIAMGAMRGALDARQVRPAETNDRKDG